MFPEFAHWVKPPFKVLSIPAAKYRSPESSRRPEAFQRIDRLCRLTLRCLDELSVPWYKTMTTVSSIYVTRAVAMNFKIGFWAATGKTANAPLLWRNSWRRRQSHAVRLTPYWLECAAIKPKYPFLHKELSKLQRKRSQFPLWDAGVDALSRGKTGLGSKVNCTVTLWWVLRLYFPVTLRLHRLT